jgi:hypothetical protein
LAGFRRRHGTRRLPANDWSIGETEQRLADEPVEWVYVFGPDGRQRARFRGAGDQEVTVDLPPAMLRDTTLVHIHVARRRRSLGGAPSHGEPPSIVDLTMMSRSNVRALRLVTSDAIYAIERIGATWIDEAILREEIVDADATAEAIVEAEILEGRLDPAGREHRALEERLRILDEVGWLRYRKETRPRG